MSKAATSPTARLLQNSRLFSLPRPLPQPALETISSTGIYRASDSATLPYPTHQAITTPPSSHFRGDWGLKRPLPAKSTRSSTPHIRVRAQDNTEHITDFGSAADHTQTSAKWRELGIPLLARQSKESERNRSRVPISVFEEGLQATDANADARWKYDGPWLAGMQEGEFERFINQLGARRGVDGKKSVNGRSRVDDFRDYVRDRIEEREIATARREAQDQGEILTPEAIADIKDSLGPGSGEFETALLRLRSDHAKDGLSSELTTYLTAFLDLPPVIASNATSNNTSALAITPEMRGILDNIRDTDDLSDNTPPSTHSSAGLSYLRTAAIMPNHPLHGPQAHRAPVQARVVRTRNSVQGSEYQAKLGVAGVVANDPSTNTYSPDKALPSALDKRMGEPNRMANELDVNIEGGNKIWVHPTTAYIDDKGRIRLEVARGNAEAVAVKQDDVEYIHEQRAQGPGSSSLLGGAGGFGGFGRGAASAPPGTNRNANFGVGLPRTPQSALWASSGKGRQPVRRREEVKGFDGEVSGEDGDEAAMRRLSELAGLERGG